MNTSSARRTGLPALALGTVVVLAGCSSTGTSGSAPPGASAEPGARLAVSYGGGVRVLDGASLRSVSDFASEEFTRLNPAGDDRHVLVTTSRGFQVLDTGAGTTTTGALTDRVFAADTPGHVVRHAGRTVLYADGTSDTTVFDPAALAASDALPQSRTIEGTQAHHGVSVVLEDGTFLTTVGDADGRTGITVQDPSGRTVATSDRCPGVHGEGTARGEAVVLGCEDGALLYRDGEITKLDAPGDYARMGNAYVSETSPVVVGDHKDDPDAEGYLLDQITLIDTDRRTLEVVDLPEGVEYTFRGVARGPGDLAYVLGTDGAVHELDPRDGTVRRSMPVVAPWEGPAEWQDPHPAIVVSGSTAYVTEPATRSVHALDLTTGERTATGTLDVVPNEVAVASGPAA
ncbi:hypothetical protein SAMN04488544_1717 [Microlunatus sagamiharensis]|uniref:PQQ-like domain-containing protein n=1 Tax=Microlunatus sagamiharensis TaxID=546874 RepID=A0A1H2MCX3_9ACTN|nr:zinc metallochaperone AztD [Microlunatus sagamiharensis]SDU90326.1 hypothetical protein SAMN04488544_1717 [Microlunatus sagamiharensis]